MDRTMIAPWKAEERELSEKLYQKLVGLTLLYPPTEELRKCLSEDMFLKPNQPAFFQVMHYLIKLHDPVEFRKRFYWPINDKRAEANFRSSTIEYLKYLDEKHQLHWSNIKSYLVHMPGGMKFIIFLLDFVSFIIMEQIKLREKQFTNNVELVEVTDVNLRRMQKQNEFFKEYASVYISEADALIIKFKERTSLVRKELTKIASIFRVDFKDLIATPFLKEFEASNRELFVKRFKDPTTRITDLEHMFVQLKEAIENFQSRRNEWQINEDVVANSLSKIKELFPNDVADDAEFKIAQNEGVTRINTLISAFTIIYPFLREQLEIANEIPRSNNFLKAELSSLQNEFQRIESQIADFQKRINTHTKRKNDSPFKQNPSPVTSGKDGPVCQAVTDVKGNNLLAKFVATPPIKLEMIEVNRSDINTRLPLLEDITLNGESLIVANAKAATDSLHSLLAHPRSARKIKNLHNSFDLNGTMSKSKIIDPIQLLRTISKRGTPTSKTVVHDRSTANFRWKTRQCIFGNDIKESTKTETNVNSGEESTIQDNGVQPSLEYTIASPFRSLNSNESVCASKIQTKDICTGGGGSIFFTKKLAAIEKVQTTSLNFHNLSTSPSGRLDPLVNFEERDVPKLQLNDVTLREDYSIYGKQKHVRDTIQVRTTSPGKSHPTDQAQENNENNSNFTNTVINYRFNLSGVGEGNELFNISDSVLKDVIM